MSSGPRLVRAPVDAAPAPRLDADQQAVVEHRGGPLLVLAGPGTGKTTTLVESVVHRVEHDGLDPGQVLLLTFGRRAAAELRDRVAARLARTTREPLARTLHSYAFGLLRREAVLTGEPTPRLLAGPEQDLLVRELLRGDLDELGADYWPASLRAALPTRGFAEELRDLLARAAERGVTPDRLAGLGARHHRPDWVAAATFARQYAGVTALRRPPAYDPAELVAAAVDLLLDDPDVLARERSARRFVLVDEYQDTDPAQEQLLYLLAGGGADLVAVGDPDQSVYGFRGADPEGLRRFPDRFRRADGQPAPVRALGGSRRAGPVLLAASRRVAQRLGGPVGHRRLRAAGAVAEGSVEVAVLASAGEEAALVAHRLRTAHLADRIDYGRMAVLVRSAAALPALRRGLAAAGVPTAVRLDELALVEQPPVRALLDVLDVAVDPHRLDLPQAIALLTGPFGGADALALRRLRRELRTQELATGGARSSAVLLVEALQRRVDLVALDPVAVAPARRVADSIARARAVLDDPVRTVEDALWTVWSASGLADRWSRAALAGSVAADRDLDAVVALFDTVARFVDRLPAAGPQAFLDSVRGQEVPADTLAPRGAGGPAVQVMTAHAAKGLEFDAVAVVGVQEGVWPDLRVHGSVLGADDLVDLVAGRDSTPVTRSTARLAEERRLFYVAITRARRRLVVTAVGAEDAQPSRFLDELDPQPADATPRPVVTAPRGLDLPAVVAELRRAVVDPTTSAPHRRGAATQLARLADAGVRGADPAGWWGVLPLSTADPLRAEGSPVRVSPSKVDAFSRCPLRWVLESAGGTAGDTVWQGVGALVHQLAEDAAGKQWGAAELLAAFEERWQRLDVGAGWVARREHARAQRMVRRLAAAVVDPERQLLGVEVPFEVRLERAVLAGRVDRLERDAAGRLVVVDLKTGRSRPTAKEVAGHPQLATYQLAVERGGFAGLATSTDSGGAELLQVGDPGTSEQPTVQRQAPLAEATDPGWAHELLTVTAEGMAAAQFAATPSARCATCPVRGACPARPEGRQVSA